MRTIKMHRVLAVLTILAVLSGCDDSKETKEKSTADRSDAVLKEFMTRNITRVQTPAEIKAAQQKDRENEKGK